MQTDKNSRSTSWFIAGTVCSCVLQLLWFAPKCFNQIDIDGMAYLGIARHIHRGEFHAAINAFRSPLISWLIAAASVGSAGTSAGYVHIGKLINIATFLLSLALLYVLTEKLWHSRLVASVAVLMFSLGRGLSSSALSMVTPDFLFAALTLLYFIILLQCLREDRLKSWFSLGVVHGLAFLAKAFALPWLAVCTLVALAFSVRPWKARAARLVLAALIPVLVASGWATVLHSKYGVFTTGTQFKVNLLQWTLHAYSEHRDSTYALLTDTSKEVDEFGAGDPMPPDSWPWTYVLTPKRVVPKMIGAETRNAPRVLKELMIVTTLGGLVAFLATLAILTSRRRQYPVEWRFAVVVAASALTLVTTYSTLVFDERYLFPLVPLLLAVAARFLVPDAEFDHDQWRKLCIALVVLGTIASMVYPSSPFRLLTRDFQSSCYDAGHRLQEHAGSRVVTIGSGPFPEHGVGWEAGFKASFFGQRRIVAATEALPQSTQLSSLAADIRKAAPDAILVWGKPDDTRYAGLLQSLTLQHPRSPNEKIVDPVLGEVGTVLFTTPTLEAVSSTPAVGRTVRHWISSSVEPNAPEYVDNSRKAGQRRSRLSSRTGRWLGAALPKAGLQGSAARG
jgi:Dolichyl-phosphate-mannose-protein mannosyltransferase